MNESSVSPEEFLRLPSPAGTFLIVVFVPSKDRDEKDVDQGYWVKEIRSTLGNLFRGASAYPHVGRADEKVGALTAEEPVMVFAYASGNDLNQASLSILYQTLARMGQSTNQGEIGVVLDCKYYGISDYSGASAIMTENEIQQALHAARVVPLKIADPYGPLGLRRMATEVDLLRGQRRIPSDVDSSVPENWDQLLGLADSPSVVVQFAPETWDQLLLLLDSAHQNAARSITTADLVRDIVERYLAGVQL